MNIRRLFILLLFSVFIASCFKYIKVDNSIKYTIDGFHDVQIDQNDSASLGINCLLLSGNPANEYITMTVTGLPDSVTINQDSITFRPNYYFYLVFYAHSPKPGVYPISVKLVSPTMGTKIYTFNLTVTSVTDCTQQLSQSQVTSFDGRFQVRMSGSSSNVYGYIHRTGCDTLYIKVVIDSMEPGSEPDGVIYPVAAFFAVVNCTANSLNIYPQTAQWLSSTATDKMVKGSGHYVPATPTTATITLNDTVYSGSQISSVTSFTIY